MVTFPLLWWSHIFICKWSSEIRCYNQAYRDFPGTMITRSHFWSPTKNCQHRQKDASNGGFWNPRFAPHHYIPGTSRNPTSLNADCFFLIIPKPIYSFDGTTIYELVDEDQDGAFASQKIDNGKTKALKPGESLASG